VISEDFAFFGFDQTTWDRLVSLVTLERDGEGVVVVVVNRFGITVACFHTARGMLDPKLLPAPGDLEGLCEVTGSKACIVMREQAMKEVADYLAEPLDADEEYDARVLRFARVVRELGNGNWLRVWPNPFPNLVLAAAPAAKSATDILLPDGHTVVVCVFDEGEVWTGAALRRSGGKLDALVGPVAIADWAGPLGGAWERDQRVVARAIERELGPVHLGVYMDRSTAEDVFHPQNPGGWAVAHAARDLIANPLPPYLAAGFGIDMLRGTASAAANILEGIEPEELATIAKGFWRGLTDGRGLQGLLDLLPIIGPDAFARDSVTADTAPQKAVIRDTSAPDTVTPGAATPDTDDPSEP
jgi:hypothetical protein